MRKKKNKTKELIVTGTIRIHTRGFGFLIPEDRAAFPEDIFIPPHCTRGAVDGDLVEAAINLQAVSEKGPEGAILKIVKRGRSHLAGIITYISKKHGIYAHAPLLAHTHLLQIMPSKERELKIGDRVIIEVLEWGGARKKCLGKVSAFLGHISDATCDTTAAIEEYELHKHFHEDTLKEAKSFGTQVSSKDCENRKDLRSLECFTIDPDTAKDFDDALSLSCDREGRFHLGVHIADVSHYVKPGSSLDKEAYQRCNSVYFPNMVLPMLPHELSSHLCSLKPQVNRLAVSVLITLDNTGALLDYQICRSVIRSQKRFTYKEAKQVLDGEIKSKFAKPLALMAQLCALLKKRRYERGSIEFALPDLSLSIGNNGEVQKMELIEYDISHQLVEEFMLLANETVATHLSRQEKPLTYRIHEEPNPENMREFAAVATALGFILPKNPTTEELQLFFDHARSTAFGQFLATAFIKSMKLASYSTQNIGHYGLGLEHYTHFTSPIRRYIDLVVHRLLFDETHIKTDLEEIALRCSDKERLSAKAESSVTLLKKLRYLENRRKNGHSFYEAMVISVKPSGLLFELSAFMYEGFLPLKDLKFPLGTKIMVDLKQVDLVTRQTEWALLMQESTKSKRRRK